MLVLAKLRFTQMQTWCLLLLISQRLLLQEAVATYCLLSFISCNFQVGHDKISQNLTTALLKARLLFNVVSISVNSFHPSLNKSMYSHPVQDDLRLQPMMHGILQCLINGVNVLSRAFSQRSKQVIIWWCEFKTAGRMQVEISWLQDFWMWKEFL
jgi:hypothetical protein